MAIADYEVRGTGIIATVANLAAQVGQGETTFLIENLIDAGVTPVEPGQAILVGKEICRLEAIDLEGGTIGVARGCADTIPAPHAKNTPIFFFDDAVGSDDREYLAGETVGVKILMRTTREQMAISASPPNTLTFGARFARPYPPGRMRVNGKPWYQETHLVSVNGGLALTWAHRDRISQADQLIGHEEGSVGPENGVDYRIVVRDDGGTLLRVIDVDGSASGFTYTLAQAITDFGIPDGSTDLVNGYLTVSSERDGFLSWQSYRINFQINPAVPGWGENWGLAWG